MRKAKPRGWFRRVAAEFSAVVARFADKPFTYVEVGCWSGNSIRWMLSNIMTHPESRGVGIDPYLPDVKHDQIDVDAKKDKAYATTLAAYQAGRWIWFYEDSKTALPKLCQRIDLLYLDGSHQGWDVVIDFATAWKNLAVGSVVIFDDLSPARTHHEPHVREAFEAIKLAWGTKVKVIHYGPKQAALEVVEK